MPTPLRSLSGLIDFDAAARWGSFRLAAVELHKTAAAVSQQVRQLEQALGFALFQRHPRQIDLTDKGRELAATVARLLGELRGRVGALQQADAEAVLRVSTTHSFAMKWLVPRLHRFSARHPALDLRLEATDAVVPLEPGRCDVAIRYARVDARDPAEILLREQLVLVHAPGLPGTRAPDGGTVGLAALLQLPLLYEETPARWLAWLRANDLPVRRHDFARGYSHGGLLVQAAVAGLGLALVPLALAGEDIAQGRLQRVPSRALQAGYDYRLHCAEAARELPRVGTFIDWLREEAAGAGEPCN
jgi:LysR family glycine cleavage system transcriptional activator